MINSKSCPPNKKKSRTMSLGKQIIMQAPVWFPRKYVQKIKLNLFFGLQKNKLAKFSTLSSFSVLASIKKINKKTRLKHVTKNKKAPNSTTIIF